MKVAVVAEFYPSRRDPVLGVWAHRQALAARAAGAEVLVVVLHRLIPPRTALHAGVATAVQELRERLREPRAQTLDGLPVRYIPYVSPPRARGYPHWGAWAAPVLGAALRRLQRSFPFELVHAHNAVPAADAVIRTQVGAPLIVSVHGGDVLYTAAPPPLGSAAGARAVARGLSAARLTLANSQGIAELCRAHGAGEVRVVHLGADLPEAASSASSASGAGGTGGADGASGTGGTSGGGGAKREGPPTLITVGHLVARKRHADVLRTLAVLGRKHPTLRYEIVGDGPERVALEGLAARLGVSDRVDMLGQLPPEEALARVRRATLFAMPSTEEAFGVAYIEAMAGGVPAIGCRGEPGPEEIAVAGDGLVLVPPGDIERLTQRIGELLSDPQRLRETGRRARETVAANFTWERCGRETVAAYEHVLAGAR